jgi:hypothetical protein
VEVEALRKNKREDETQFITKIDGILSLIAWQSILDSGLG